MEASREVDTAQMRDKILRQQAVPTPEETFEQLWQQLRLDLDSAQADVQNAVLSATGRLPLIVQQTGVTVKKTSSANLAATVTSPRS